MRIVDLSLPLHPSQPVFPGDDPTEFQVRGSDGWVVHRVCLVTHAGTHLDAPAHLLPGGLTIDDPDILDACAGDAVIRDVPGEPGAVISPEDIRGLEDILASEERLILRTGWSARYGAEDYHTRYPAVSPSLARMLAASGIRLLGLDTPSADPANSAEAHETLFGAGIAIVENLANLDRITVDRFFFSAAPLKLSGLDGSPVRAYALLP